RPPPGSPLFPYTTLFRSRAFSLFSIFAVITLGMTAFCRFTEDRQLSLWVLGATSVVLIAILYLPIAEMQTLIDPAIQRAAAAFRSEEHTSELQSLRHLVC